jgi:hypothetical protein
MTKEEILQKCTVVGNIVKLPEGQLDRKLYMEVAKSLELIGGKWKGGSVMGFVFPTDPTDLLSQISNGEKRNLKKEFQFFGTPEGLADKLVELANIRYYDIVCEPSAGQGAIVKSILKNGDITRYESYVRGYELMPLNQTFLSKIEGFRLLGEDFLKCEYTFDRIVANPPFSGNQDIDHIKMMYDHLSEGGRLVSMASKHWVLSTNKKETDFRNWLKEVGAETEDVPAGTFKESGTNVETVIVIINK